MKPNKKIIIWDSEGVDKHIIYLDWEASKDDIYGALEMALEHSGIYVHFEVFMEIEYILRHDKKCYWLNERYCIEVVKEVVNEHR